MPPRYAYWTILAGGLPTAFRAADREDLLPTFRRIQEKHPDAEMKYFAKGKLWDSREAAYERPPRRRLDRESRGGGPAGARRPATDRRGGHPPNRRGGPVGPPDPEREHRGRDWRPGGEHRDPRQRFKDAKAASNAARRKARFARKHARKKGSS
ncbi:MAG: hypothetical protein HY657_10250 [Acidobacteria bacterium]|nr:hypothetical protein [Acidobacteriota bacterium]